MTEEELEIMKKKYIGQLLRSMNSLEFIANQYVYYHFVDLDFYELTAYVQEITLEDIHEFMQEWVSEEQLTVCTVKSS